MEFREKLVTTRDRTTALLQNIKEYFERKTIFDFSKVYCKTKATKPAETILAEELCRKHEAVFEVYNYTREKQTEFTRGSCGIDYVTLVTRVKSCFCFSVAYSYTMCS